MKCFIENFRELDIDELLAVNGGYGNSSGGGYGKNSGGTGSYGRVTTSSGNQSSWDVWVNNKDGRNISGEITRPHDPNRDVPRNPSTYESSSFIQDNNLGGGTGSGDGNVGEENSSGYQIPFDPNDYHCDIKAYNEAVEHGASNPGDWDGNVSSVNEIYNENYEGQGTSSPNSNTSGYIFYDFDNDGSMDHMEYYETGSDSTYTVFQTDGISDTTQVVYDSNVDSNGSASSGTATFVPIQ